MDLSTTIAKTHFSNCFMNASGAWCRTSEELHEIATSQSGAVVTKSCTLNERDGNPKPRYVDLPLGSINSMGLPNLGVNFYKQFTESQTEKTILVSVAGLSLEENLQILTKLKESSANFLVELNLSCPNIAGKPQTGYDFERTKEVLTRVFEIYPNPLGVKLPPYFDMVHFQDMAAILNAFPLSFVTCINSIGNGLFIDTDTEQVVIHPKEGFGGMGGDYVKPTALANVRMFYKLLRPEIAIIGVGGIKSGKDAFEHILCGATAVQIGTQLMKDGVSVFERVQNELKVIMKEKGYHELSDFRGKLKTLPNQNTF